MSTFESKQQHILTTEDKVFNFWSNFDNIKNVIPPNVLSNLKSSGDSCQFTFKAPAPINKEITGNLKIVDKVSYKVIKYGAENMPLNFNLWIQLRQVGENDTRVKVTIKAKLNAMIKIMYKKKLQEMVNGLSELIAKIPYQ